MSKIFYIGEDGQVYGPFTELEVQAWYASGFLSSDIKFQISMSDSFDPDAKLLSLGELIDLNGRTLPFYFSPEKANIEMEQENRLNQLKQEIESLRASFNIKLRNDEEVDHAMIGLLQGKISTLQESHADIIYEEKDLEETLNQVKQEIESLRTSLKDQHRNQNEKVSVLDSRIATLVKSNSELLEKLNAISNKKEASPERSQIEKKMTEIKKKVDEQEKSLASMKKEISAVNSKCDRNDSKLEKLIEKQNETEGRANGFGNQIAELKSSEKSIRESINTCDQNVASTSNELKTITTDLNGVKKEIEEQKKESSSRWSEYEVTRKNLQTSIDVVEELCKESQSKVFAEKSEKLSSNAENLPPWDQKKGKKTVEAGSKSREKMPWEDEQRPSGSETLNVNEPWNAKNGGSSKGSVDTKKAVNGTSSDQKAVETGPKGGGMPWDVKEKEKKKIDVAAPSTDEKVAAEKPKEKKKEVAPAKVETKPVSRAKNWDAICRDLSDDDEEELQAPPAAIVEYPMRPEETVQSAVAFTQDLIGMFDMYCSAMDNGKFSLLKSREYPFEKMVLYQARMNPSANPLFDSLSESLKNEMRKMANMPIYCHACNFLLATPYLIYMHFMGPDHIDSRAGDLARYAVIFDKLTTLISGAFHLFIGPPEEPLYQETLKNERRLKRIGLETAAKYENELRRMRPTEQFKVKMMNEVATNVTLSLDIPAEALADVRPAKFNEALQIKAIGAQLRTWLPEGNNRQKLEKKFEKHLKEGVAFCSSCAVAYEDIDDYYQHMTSYSHSLNDQSMFSAFMVQWKGPEYWNSMF